MLNPPAWIQPANQHNYPSYLFYRLLIPLSKSCSIRKQTHPRSCEWPLWWKTSITAQKETAKATDLRQVRNDPSCCLHWPSQGSGQALEETKGQRMGWWSVIRYLHVRSWVSQWKLVQEETIQKKTRKEWFSGYCQRFAYGTKQTMRLKRTGTLNGGGKDNINIE